MYLTNSDDVARRLSRNRSVLLVAALVLLATFFLLGPVPENLPTVSSADGDKPFVLPYLAVFTGYLGWSQLDVVISTVKAWNAQLWNLRWGVRLWVAGGCRRCPLLAGSLALHHLVDLRRAAAMARLRRDRLGNLAHAGRHRVGAGGHHHHALGDKLGR